MNDHLAGSIANSVIATAALDSARALLVHLLREVGPTGAIDIANEVANIDRTLAELREAK